MSAHWHINQSTDRIVIIGGGPVGSIAALGLAQQGWRVLILEASEDKAKRWGYDARTLAINLGSHRLLTQFGIPSGAHWSPINQVRVTQQYRRVSTNLSAQFMQTDVLGHTIIASQLGALLDERLEQNPNIEMRLGSALAQLSQTDAGVAITTQQGEMITAPFVLACDGAQSPTRNALGLSPNTHDFNQIAMLSRLMHEQPHHGIAQERFLSNGVLALLPLPDTEEGRHQSSMVWIQKTVQAEQTLRLSSADLLTQINQTFDGSFGVFTNATDLKHYPIKQTLSNGYMRQRVALLGNAAHALHPIAGQGLNIGIRDVAQLLEQTTQTMDSKTIQAWADQRKRDAQKSALLTRAMVFGFSTPVIKQMAGVSLFGIEHIHPLKRRFTRYMMGI